MNRAAEDRQVKDVADILEKAFPDRIDGTGLTNPDFVKWAESFGARGLNIRAPEDALPALDEALAHEGPVVVDVAASLEHISAYSNLSSLRPN